MEEAREQYRHLRREVLRAHDADSVSQDRGVAFAFGGGRAGEGQRAREHREEDDTEAPNVGARGIVPLQGGRDENLRCGIHHGTHLGVLEVAGVARDVAVHGRQPKVGHLRIVVRVEQNVLWLEITMVDTVLVAVRESVQYLDEVALGIVLGEPAALGDSIEQLAAMAQPVTARWQPPGV